MPSLPVTVSSGVAELGCGNFLCVISSFGVFLSQRDIYHVRALSRRANRMCDSDAVVTAC
jgi:hypothetical protein